MTPNFNNYINTHIYTEREREREGGMEEERERAVKRRMNHNPRSIYIERDIAMISKSPLL